MTALTRFEPLAPELRDLLQDLWIESVEGLLGLVAAVGADPEEAPAPPGLPSLDEVRRGGVSLLGEQATTLLLKPAPGGNLGCQVAPEQWQRYLALGRVERERTAGPASLGSSLPSSVRLTPRLPEVRDQGARGTCVAFAATALREYLAGRETRLSEQFLHWACKELDGVNRPGTYLRTAMSALARHGVCRGASWPYNPLPLPHNEGQGPPPPEALTEALGFQMPNARTVEPQLPAHYREMLAGTEGRAGSPVVVGTLAFNSWFLSPATHRTGRITLPLPGERPIGGHAWCIVGYVDDPTVPGGGYFIVRNSWGPQWAAEGLEAPGHALMPYRYAELCALEAFTAPAESPAPERPRRRRMAASLTDPVLDEFASPLAEEARDLRQALHPAGTRVLADPLEPHLFLPDGPAQRQAFLQRDCTWSDATRQRLWFPALETWEGMPRQEGERVAEARLQARAAYDANLRDARGTPFPFLRRPRWLDWFLPYEWVPKIRRVTLVADLSDQLVALVARDATKVADLPWPAAWQALLGRLNYLHRYEMQGYGRSLEVLVGFVQRFRCERAGALGETPKLVPQPLDNDFATQVLRRCSASSGQPVFVSLSTGLPLAPDASWHQEQQHWIVLCRRLLPPAQPPLASLTRFCEAPDETRRFRPALPEGRDFLERLKPESDDERTLRVRDCVEALGRCASLTRIAKETGYRRSVVRSAALRLQRDGDYRLSSPSALQEQWGPDTPVDDRVVLQHASLGEGSPLSARALGPNWLRRHALRIGAFALGVGVNHLAGYLQREFGPTGWIGTGGFSLAILIMYVGSQLQARMNRQADREQE
jgi:hypothetical protein